MKTRLFTLAAAVGALALSACDDLGSHDDTPEVTPPPAEDSAVPVADEAPAAVAPPAPTDAHPDSSTLPSEKRTSEETVRPDSETLFY